MNKDIETVRDYIDRSWPDQQEDDVSFNAEAQAALGRIGAEVERLVMIRELLVKSLVRATGADEDAVREAPLTRAIRHAEEVERLQADRDAAMDALAAEAAYQYREALKTLEER